MIFFECFRVNYADRKGNIGKHLWLCLFLLSAYLGLVLMIFYFLVEFWIRGLDPCGEDKIPDKGIFDVLAASIDLVVIADCKGIGVQPIGDRWVNFVHDKYYDWYKKDRYPHNHFKEGNYSLIYLLSLFYFNWSDSCSYGGVYIFSEFKLMKRIILMFGLTILFQLYYTIIAPTELIFNTVEHHIQIRELRPDPFTAGLTSTGCRP